VTGVGFSILRTAPLPVPHEDRAANANSKAA